MGHKHWLLALLAGALLSLQMAARSAESETSPEVNQAQRLVFMNDYLSDVAFGRVLTYDFVRRGTAVEAFSDTVKVKVTGMADDGRRDLEFDFLTGPNHVDFHPAKAYKGNPVMIHFLERDVLEMSKRTGGNPGYLKNRIRRSFSRPGIRPVTIDLQGRTLEAVEIAVTPFTDDPGADEMSFFVGKRYVFVFTDELPGGLYQIRTLVPDDSGGDARIEEELTFSEISPAT